MIVMDKFIEIKEEILRRAKVAYACVEQYKRAYSAETMQELAKVIKDNFNWVCQNKVIDVELIGTYQEEFAEVEIYANKSTDSGYVLINGNVDRLSGNAIAWMCGNSTVTEMCGNSTVTEMCGNSTVTWMYDNSTVTEMYGNSTVTEMCGNSTVTWMCDNSTVTEMCGNSTVTEMCGNSTVTEMCGNSTVTWMCGNSTVTEMCGNSTVTEMCGNSTVTWMYGNSYISTYNYIECKLNDKAIMRVRNTGKVYTYAEIEKPKN